MKPLALGDCGAVSIAVNIAETGCFNSTYFARLTVNEQVYIKFPSSIKNAGLHRAPTSTGLLIHISNEGEKNCYRFAIL